MALAERRNRLYNVRMNTNLLQELSAAIKASDKTLKVIAAETGVPYHTLTKLAAGRRTNPRLSTIAPLLAYFGMALTVSPATSGAPTLDRPSF